MERRAGKRAEMWCRSLIQAGQARVHSSGQERPLKMKQERDWPVGDLRVYVCSVFLALLFP